MDKKTNLTYGVLIILILLVIYYYKDDIVQQTQYKFGTLVPIGGISRDLMGCTDVNAWNFVGTANKDDGSCFYPLGCCDPQATNYDPSADSCDFVYFLTGQTNNELACEYS